MIVSKFDRFLPIAGVIAGLIMLSSWIPTGPDTPDDPKMMTYLRDHQTALTIAGLLTGLGCVAMLFFATALRQALRSGEPGESSYSSVAYSGAVLVALSGVTNGMLSLGQLDAAHNGHAQIVQTLAYLGEFGWLAWVAPSAVMLLGTGIGAMRTAILPKWLAIVTVVLGVLCLLGPTGVIVFFVEPFWFMITGAVLYRRLASPASHVVAGTPIPAGV